VFETPACAVELFQQFFFNLGEQIVETVGASRRADWRLTEVSWEKSVLDLYGRSSVAAPES
jgi:hypothetical protein